MKEKPEAAKSGSCLNCGTHVDGNYCSNCGQKFQPTKLPLRLFIRDAVETLFNVDNRWLRTLKDLFLKPGKVTKEYIDGKRAQYLPPLRIYLSISIVYFLLIQITDSKEVFFIDFSGDDQDGMSAMGTVIQYALFLLVPVFAWITQLFHLKRKAFYVEYLIFSLHIHTVWFVFLMIELFTVWLGGNFDENWVPTLALILSIPAQALTYIFLVIYTKKTFEQKWVTAVFKSLGIMIFYMFALVLVTAAYIFLIIPLFE
ncbi:MAG: DUF3667 domain-containing protein [Balneola sp.]|nr:MAG: DUF3667 domain-containing protein [Balneola sp.]